MIQPNDVILFQGDSITDANRVREVNYNPLFHTGMGTGYAGFAAARILHERPQDNLRFHNRGISGNRITDLYSRWKVDGLNLEPTVISILVGINDVWHEFGRKNGVSVKRYADVYRILLEDTRVAIPGIRLILGEPFALEVGAVTEEWFDDLAQRQKIVKDFAAEFGAVFVPFQQAFNDALKLNTDPKYWVTDGVHPTAAGHYLMAQTWYDAVMKNE